MTDAAVGGTETDGVAADAGVAAAGSKLDDDGCFWSAPIVGNDVPSDDARLVDADVAGEGWRLLVGTSTGVDEADEEPACLIEAARTGMVGIG